MKKYIRLIPVVGVILFISQSCSDSSTDTAAEGSNDSGRDNATVVVEVSSATGRVWMDRNLGASRAATSPTDAQAYGDLYQWGRGVDGHQNRSSPTTNSLSSSDQPGHGSFILVGNNTYDWRTPQSNNLWQGLNGINNPCPSGYRLPTAEEWEAERNSWSSKNAAGAFASPLKLPLSGLRHFSNGSLRVVSTNAYYWSATVNGPFAHLKTFGNNYAALNSHLRAFGHSIRCIKD